MKNAYLVKLNLQVGEYEKSSVHLVEAEFPIQATKIALEGECHNDIGDGAEYLNSDQVEDAHGEMIYTLHSVKKVDSWDVPSLRKYL